MQVRINKDQIQEAAKTDLNVLGQILLGEDFEFQFPPVMQVTWQELQDGENLSLEKGLYKLALGLPRGHAKTTVIKMFVVWCICYTNRSFFLIVSATEKLATDVLGDIWDFLLSPNFKSIYGDITLQIEKDSTEYKIFHFKGRDIIIRAKGAGQSLRGINRKNKRPDVIIMEDMQTHENAVSPTQADQLLTWMVGTLLKARSYRTCLVVFIGNMYATEGSILRKLKKAPDWVSFIVGAILTDGTALWPEYFSVERLKEELASDLSMGKAEVFLAEMLNDETAGLITNFDPAKIPPYPYELEEKTHMLPQGKAIILDLATDKKGADDNVITLIHLIDGMPVVRKIIAGKFSPGELIENTLRLAMEEGCRLICAESVAYQYTILYWFEKAIEELGIDGIQMEPLYTGGVAKNARILLLFKQLIKGEIILHPEVRNLVAAQASQFDKLRSDNKDDILDTIAYVPKVMEEYRYAMETDLEMLIDDPTGGQIIEFNSAF